MQSLLTSLASPAAYPPVPLLPSPYPMTSLSTAHSGYFTETPGSWGDTSEAQRNFSYRLKRNPNAGVGEDAAQMSMEELRSSLCKYENENTLLSPDAQIGVRKSVGTAFGREEGLDAGRWVYGVVYLYSLDFEGIVNGLCNPRLPPKTSPQMKTTVDLVQSRWI